MTKEELAGLINGREYRKELSGEECREARKSGLVVIFGASDDLCEFEGAASNELDCYDGGEFVLFEDGKVFDIEEEVEGKNKHVNIKAEWCKDGYSWVISVEGIPFAPFDILEDGEKYCRGIVIDLADIGKEA